MSVRIVFETHSTTTDNEAGLATGLRPGTLSPAGRGQARELGERRRGDGIAAVFSSDLRRAVATARIAFAGSAVPLRRDRRLRECDYGDLTGRPHTFLAPLRARHVDVPFPGGRSYREAVEDVDGFLSDLAAEWEGARVLLIGHSATLWALEHLLADADLEDLVLKPPRWRPGWEYTLRTG